MKPSLVDLPTFVGVALLVGVVGGAKIDDYCKHNSYNTPCATQCYRSTWCGQTKDGYASLTDDERNQVLKKHNTLRAAVAEGKHLQLPACSGGISTLSYDKELEFLAGCHIKACYFEHDSVRLTTDGRSVGQNLYQASTSVDVGFHDAFLDTAIQSWFNEITHVTNPKIVAKFTGGAGIGHLTAMIWGNTRFVGCAKMHYIQYKMHHYALYCDYQPVGNIIGAPIYKEGSCDKNSEYGSLCGKIRPIADDTYIAPIQLDKGCSIGGWSMLVYLVWNLLFIIFLT